MGSATPFDWQSWLACGLGVLAVLHLAWRWWPRHRADQVGGDQAESAHGSACAVKAPSACGSGGCGSCSPSAAPIRVHRKASHDNPGANPGA